jgi:Glyoxalase/Bleomycin resistance protein/Dioxygenase superfamily
MKVNRLTPVLMVDRIEPCLPFWVDRLGFSKTTEVPHGDRLGFVILARDGVELMYQTRASVRDDVAPLADNPMGGSALYIDVDDLATVQQALSDITPVIPRRTTFYGAQELIVREPGGNTVAFAQFSTASV